jgi:hypothetical protein
MLGQSEFRWAWAPLLLLLGACPASGQALTFAELEGAVIEARFLRQQTLLREGREVSNQFQNDLKIEIGPADRIQQTINPTAYTQRGTRKGKTTSGSFTVEHAREIPSRGGATGFLSLPMAHSRSCVLFRAAL